MLFGCRRANVFHYLHSPTNPKQVDPRLQRILDNGTAVHEWVQDKYLSYSTKYWFVKEPKIEVVVEGALIRGSCDGVLIRRKDLYRWGWELKTMGHTEFEKLTGPKAAHVHQVRFYMELQNLPWMTILYWDKDKQFLREYNVKRDPAVWDKVREEVRELYSYVRRFRKTRKPKSLPVFNKQTCDTLFCQYVKYCKKMGAPVNYQPMRLR